MHNTDSLTKETKEYIEGVLINYIKYARNLGYTKEEINQILVNNGHNADLINIALEHAKEEIFDKKSHNHTENTKLEKAEIKVNEEIISFIKTHIKRGYTIEEIEEILKHLGHDSDLITDAFEKSKIKKEPKKQIPTQIKKTDKIQIPNVKKDFLNILKKKTDKYSKDLNYVDNNLNKLKFEQSKSRIFKGPIIYIWTICFIVILSIVISTMSGISLNIVLRNFLPSILTSVFLYFLDAFSIEFNDKFIFIIPIIISLLIFFLNFDNELNRILRISILNIVINYISILITKKTENS